MSQCKSCRTFISSDKEYCDRCSRLREDKSKESYLDDLLKSVTSSYNGQKYIRPKQVNHLEDDVALKSNVYKELTHAEDNYNNQKSIIEKPDNSSNKEQDPIKEEQNDNVNAEQKIIIEEQNDKTNVEQKIIIKEYIDSVNTEQKIIMEEQVTNIINQDNSTNNDNYIKYIKEQDDKCSETLNDKIIKKQDDINLRRENDQDNQNEEVLDNTDDLLALFQDNADNNTYDEHNSNQESDMDETDEDLLALLDMITGQEEASINENDSYSEIAATDSKTLDYQEDSQETDNDIFAIDDLFNEESLTNDYNLTDETDIENNLFSNELFDGILSQDESSYNDISISDENTFKENNLNYNEEFDENSHNDYFNEDFLNMSEFDLFNNQPDDLNSNDFKVTNGRSETPKDVGGVFSDVLSAVNSLEDEEDNLLNMIPDVSEIKKEKNKDRKSKTFQPEIDNQVVVEEKKEGFWKKLFSKKTIENIGSADDKDNLESSNSESNKKSAVDKNKDKKEKKVKKAKAAKQKVKKNNKKASNTNTEEENEGLKSTKTKNKKAKVKKEKKEKLPKQIVEELDADDENGKISKIAIAIVATVGIAFVGFVLIGTNVYTYSLGVKNATINFDRQRYREAYDDIYGLDLNEEDQILYNKILTVMYVNKQLKSYEAYYTIEKYPEALNSLLKGLEKYDKHISAATEMGINKHLDTIKDKLLAELKDKFNMTEKEAIAINNSENQTQYSINVINAVLEKMN